MTLHIDQRMNQRGIPRTLVDFVLDHGKWVGDRCTVDRKLLDSLIAHYDQLRRLAIKARDKGGLVVVEAGGNEITTYPIRRRRGARR
jgi:hypothetical protein